YNAGSTGDYTLSAGTLNVKGFEIIGNSGSGTFVQSGGNHTVGVANVYAGNLSVGSSTGAVGSYTLSGGTLNVAFASAFVGGNGGAGTFTVSGTGALSVYDTLKVGNTAGTSFNLQGGSVTTAVLNTNGNPSRFVWTGGTLNITGSGGLSITSLGPLGAPPTLDAARTLNVPNALT